MNENNQANPIDLFASWYDEAKDTDMKEPGAASFSTCSKDGIPSSRMLLLKYFDDRGFCFFTNLTSRKGHELRDNPNVAICFYWDALSRQVRIEGAVERVLEKEADNYFASRMRGSQIGAWASKQSSIMEREGDLPDRVNKITEQFEGQVIPRPPFWSGYRVVPKNIEFWQSGEHRLNKRILYTKQPLGWNINRLYP